jgi:Fe-S cluster biogenesis protein NfuA
MLLAPLRLTGRQMVRRDHGMSEMRRVGRIVGVVAMVVLLLGACSSMTGKTLGENIDDAGITAAVKSKLAAEKIATVTRIDVDTNQGVVALNGTVQSEAMRVRAGELAREVKGVRDVVNNLRVQAS